LVFLKAVWKKLVEGLPFKYVLNNRSKKRESHVLIDPAMYDNKRLIRSVCKHYSTGLYSVPIDILKDGVDKVLEKSKYENIQRTRIEIPAFSLWSFLPEETLKKIKEQNKRNISSTKIRKEEGETEYETRPDGSKLLKIHSFDELVNLSPPCIKQIYEKLKKGIHCEHNERLLIVRYLSRVLSGKYYTNKPMSEYLSEEEINGLNLKVGLLFRNMSDFYYNNGKIELGNKEKPKANTSYQISYEWGLQGKGEWFRVWDCWYIKDIGLCGGRNAYCRLMKRRNPLEYFKMLKKIKDSKKESKNSSCSSDLVRNINDKEKGVNGLKENTICGENR
jgi:DNA primase large subunit